MLSNIHHGVISAAIVIAFASTLYASDARACGFWTLESAEQSVRFLWDSVSLRDARTKQSVRVALERSHDAIVHAATMPDKEVLRIEGRVVRRGKTEIGSVERNKLVLGGQEYTIDIADVPLPERSERHQFIVTVKRGDTVVLSGRAMSLLSSCAARDDGAPHARALEEEDIRNRVAFALAASVPPRR